ncbi:flagellar export chaperone FliS [Alienimonas californiensis]|uniref:Flagellar protein FliS n=1 Tax=Alienimonas californiensis TaxID=2527989 RepID=A0A517P751_9PLAN|nr:flagellar export chaperone FliS [Alienimonas californiensis]QDT15206.1 hypothetical protein CA12_12870 [Alienimonas californiensis]
MTDAAPPVPARNDYLRAAVTTANPATLHGMLADAAVRFSSRAADLLADGPDRDEAGGYAALDRATALVAELFAGVKPNAAAATGEDADAGRAIAEGVRARFAFCLGRLAEAGRNNAAAPARDAARVLTVHAETWRELLLGSAGQGGAAAAPSPEPLTFAPAPAPPAAASAASRSWAA